MGQLSKDGFARRVCTWFAQAQLCHSVLRHVTDGAEVVDTPKDGTVLVRVSAAAWYAAVQTADQPPPEPLPDPVNGTTGAASGPASGRGSGANRTRSARPGPRTRRGTPSSDNAPSPA